MDESLEGKEVELSKEFSEHFFGKNTSAKLVGWDITEKNKYYVPQIEEFCIGFTYEELCSKEWNKLISPPKDLGLEWKDKKFRTNTSLSKIVHLIKQDRIRVKCLDEGDVLDVVSELALFYEILRDDNYYKSYSLNEQQEIWYSKNNIQGIWLKHINPNNDQHNDVPFKIKNKSELKQLLNQFIH